ncbi:MAG: DUF4359 domain-containing protein [Leptolyngbyaceae cyanobacterium bins.59]|nr:DUF4359 domain-containing protein [Leptolyngbyaceae cyanobacterium bins.59]
MKGLSIVMASGVVIAVGLVAGMVVTNPGNSAYEDFAVGQLSRHLKGQVCVQMPTVFGNSLQEQCTAVVDSNRSHIKQVIVQNTQRKNFLVFSLYRTNLDVGSVLPSYQFETIGIFWTFHVLKAEQRQAAMP